MTTSARHWSKLQYAMAASPTSPAGPFIMPLGASAAVVNHSARGARITSQSNLRRIDQFEPITTASPPCYIYVQPRIDSWLRFDFLNR
jgi:hypothetical protein